MTKFIKIAGLTSVLAFASGSLSIEASAAPVEQGNIENSAQIKGLGDSRTYQDAIQELEDFVITHNVDFEIDSVNLSQFADGQDYITMGTSCTVTGTVSIAGQSFSMSATASTCSEAIGMIQEGLAAMVPL